MKISEMNESLEGMELPNQQKRSILRGIDIKISDDMKEVIAEIRQLENKIQMVHDKLSNEIKVVYWVIGIAYAIILFVLTVLTRK